MPYPTPDDLVPTRRTPPRRAVRFRYVLTPYDTMRVVATCYIGPERYAGSGATRDDAYQSLRDAIHAKTPALHA